MADCQIHTESDSRKQEIEMCLEQFKLLSHLAQTSGPIKFNGKVVSFKKIVAMEAKIAADYLQFILDGVPHEIAIDSARSIFAEQSL